MRRRSVAAGLAVLAANAGLATLLACGDKFLVPSRGLRFELSTSARQHAAVLLYANPHSALSTTLAQLSIDPGLRKVGYRPTLVATSDEFDEAMRHGGWDVVLVDLADAQAITRGGGGSDDPTVVAVAHNPTAVEFSQARKLYAAVLKSPKHIQTFVEAIDDAIALRREIQARAAKRSQS